MGRIVLDSAAGGKGEVAGAFSATVSESILGPLHARLKSEISTQHSPFDGNIYGKKT